MPESPVTRRELHETILEFKEAIANINKKIDLIFHPELGLFQDVKTNGLNISSHAELLTEVKKTLAELNRNLFVKRNGKPALTAQVDENTKALQEINDSRKYYTRLVVGQVIALAFLAFAVYLGVK